MTDLRIIVLVGIALVVLSFLLGKWLGGRLADFRETRTVEAPPPEHNGFRVEQTVVGGAKARQLFERGQPGPGETLSLYDGSHRRGVKHGSEAP